VNNNIGFCQFDIHTTGTGQPHDLQEAFNQRSWHYAKFSPCDLTSNALANIIVRLGTSYLCHEAAHVGVYLGINIPTTKKQNANSRCQARATSVLVHGVVRVCSCFVSVGP
jgi:hypothetical protein